MPEPLQQVRWYNKAFLPPWLPGWLFASLLCGVVFAVTFALLLAPGSVVRILVLFGGGFVFMLFILTLTHARSMPVDPAPTFLPPLAVRIPVYVAAAVGMGAILVDDRRITTGATHGDRVLLAGSTVVVIGVALIVGAGAMCIWLLRRRPRTGPIIAAGILGLLIVAAGLTIATIRIAQRGF